MGAKKRRAPLPWPWFLGLFSGLLVFPVWAAIALSNHIDWRFVLSFFAVLSGLTFLFYWLDKRKAIQDQWRIPEGTLHLLELLGGWPAALLAQRFLRHKTKKAKYQLIFWLIVVLHQLTAVEYVAGGRILRSVLRLVQ